MLHRILVFITARFRQRRVIAAQQREIVRLDRLCTLLETENANLHRQIVQLRHLGRTAE